jgi:Fe-S-cluster-containing hydrogenase component 2
MLKFGHFTYFIQIYEEVFLNQKDCTQCARRDFLKLASAAGIAAGLSAVPSFAAVEKIVPNLKKVAIIDQTKCQKKAVCSKKCPFRAIAKTGDKNNPLYQVEKKKCMGCGTCVKKCPSQAITLIDRNPAPSGTPAK